MKNLDNCVICGVNLSELQNRNRSRVVKCMREFVGMMGEHTFDEKSLRDIFALSMNKLPARYAQKGTIVLRDPVTKEMIYEAVEEAIDRVLNNPKD